MSTITITIETGNAAFGDDDVLLAGAEVGRILRVMADQFESIGECADPKDINGNTCGYVHEEE